MTPNNIRRHKEGSYGYGDNKEGTACYPFTPRPAKAHEQTDDATAPPRNLS